MHEERFRLVLAVMGDRDPDGRITGFVRKLVEKPVSGASCRGFDAVSGFRRKLADIHLKAAKRDAHPGTLRLNEPFVVIGLYRPQEMVDMRRGQAPAAWTGQIVEQAKQAHGIRPARNPCDDGRMRGKHVKPVYESGDPYRQGSHGAHGQNPS